MSPEQLENLFKIQTEVYKQHPYLLPRDFSTEPITFPKKIKELLDYVLDHVKKKEMFRVICKGPRGGGKTRGIASIELILWYLYNWDIINLGGSFSQAEKVYSYLTEAFQSKMISHSLESSTQRKTKSKTGSQIFVLAATEKQTRSPHIGGADKGGLLVIDEECEAEETVVNSALPTINSAHPSGIIRSSTFHKAFGTFQKTWDGADKLGYKRFAWDCFDVSEKCVDFCEAVKDKVTGEIGRCIILDHCQGRAHGNAEKGTPEAGWIPIEELRQSRREMSLDEFEVELMGMRPSGTGLVFPPEALAACLRKERFELKPSGSVCIGVDWGFEGETAIVMVQEQNVEMDKKIVTKKRIIHYEAFVRPKDDEIFSELEFLSKDFQIPMNLDESHKFQNDHLINMGAQAYEVNFRTNKERCISYLKNLMEKGLLEIPEEYDHLVSQLTQYRRAKSGKPVKKDDHGVDALVCAILHFTNEGIGYKSGGARFEITDPYMRRGRIGKGGRR